MPWDIFVSYATEDKAAVARPIANALVLKGLRVWFDELTLQPGDRLRQTIDEGLAGSNYFLVLLSPAYLGKNWTRYELDGIVQRFASREATLIPIWHNVERESVATFSPTLADVVALRSHAGPDAIAAAVCKRLQRDFQPQYAGLAEAFRATVERKRDLQIDWLEVLRTFAKSSRIFTVASEPEHSQHEHGVGGHIESTYRLADQSGTSYFVLRHRTQYMTTADDFVDYAEPSLITVEAQLPLMAPLVQTVAELVLE